jgi:very-short-patch-repair endonuclease
MAEKPMLITRARSMRKQPSRAERAVWDIVRAGRLGMKFRRQHPVEGYIADFACIDAKLIVEIDGLSHEDHAQRAYDKTRTQRLDAAGWRVLRIRDVDALSDIADVARRIQCALQT